MIGKSLPGSVKYVIANRVSNADMTGWLSDSAVKIVDGKIHDVLPASSLPSDVEETSEVLRLGDVSLMPGLVDAHCHMHCSATKDAQALASRRERRHPTPDNARRLRHAQSGV